MPITFHQRCISNKLIFYKRCIERNYVYVFGWADRIPRTQKNETSDKTEIIESYQNKRRIFEWDIIRMSLECFSEFIMFATLTKNKHVIRAETIYQKTKPWHKIDVPTQFQSNILKICWRQCRQFCEKCLSYWIAIRDIQLIREFLNIQYLVAWFQALCWVSFYFILFE